MLKLCMVSNVDRNGGLKLDVVDFNRAMNWMVEAELTMPTIFQVGTTSPDSRVMDEIAYFVKQHPNGVGEHRVINFARTKVQAHVIRAMLEAMQASRQIICKAVDKQGLRIFTAP